MKTILLITLSMLLGTSIMAESIKLPAYKKGHHEIDTIYTGNGSTPVLDLRNINLSFKFISGVKFKIVIDSNSSGTGFPQKGDTINIPYASLSGTGNVAFHIIIEGTPLIGGESYPCDLDYVFTTGQDFGMSIRKISDRNCIVDQSQGVYSNNYLQDFSLYPNPANEVLLIKKEIQMIGTPYIITNQLGVKVMSGNLLNEFTSVNINQLATGIYFVQIGKFIKPIIKVNK